jgi:predicted alpha/beta-fold hydrolase
MNLFLSFLITCFILYILLTIFQKFYLHTNVELYFTKTPKNEQIIENLPILKSGYSPTIWAFNPLVHAAVTNFRKPKKPKYERITLFNSHNQRLEIDILKPKSLKEDTPVAVIIPGIAGHSDKDYIKSFAPHVAEKYIVYIFNHPGNGDTKLSNPVVHIPGDVDDLKLLFDNVRERHQKSKMVSVGISLGGNLLSLYLGTFGKNTPLLAGKSCGLKNCKRSRFVKVTIFIRELVLFLLRSKNH